MDFVWLSGRLMSAGCIDRVPEDTITRISHALKGSKSRKKVSLMLCLAFLGTALQLVMNLPYNSTGTWASVDSDTKLNGGIVHRR